MSYNKNNNNCSPRAPLNGLRLLEKCPPELERRQLVRGAGHSARGIGGGAMRNDQSLSGSAAGWRTDERTDGQTDRQTDELLFVLFLSLTLLKLLTSLLVLERHERTY